MHFLTNTFSFIYFKKQTGKRYSAHQSLASPVRSANILSPVKILGPLNILGLGKHQSLANTLVFLCQSCQFSRVRKSAGAEAEARDFLELFKYLEVMGLTLDKGYEG